MRILTILIILPFSLFGQGIEPYQIQYSTYKNGLLQAKIGVYDEFEQDSVYYYTHVNSDILGKIDSVQYINDSLRIYTQDTTFITEIISGNIKGNGAANRVAYWASSDSLTSNANLTFTSGNIFTLIGRMVLKATTTVGDWNAFINGGNTTLTGNGNIAIGSNQTFVNATTADNNIVLGPVAGNQLTTGDNNIFLGANTGQQNTTSSNNTYVGHTSGVYNIGADNTYIGSGSGHTATNVSNNTYVGSNAGYNATNSNNVYMGFYSGFSSTNSGTFNVVIGNEASKDGGGSYNVKLGALAGNGNTGSNNVFLGYDSGRTSSTKNGNIFIGYQSGRNEDIDNSLIISNSPSTSNGIYGDFDNSKYGVNIAPASAARTWDINGELRIRDLTTDNATKLLGADNDGDVSGVIIGSGLTLSGTTLSSSAGADSTILSAGYGININESPANTWTVKADTSKIATLYDVSQVDQSLTNELQKIDTFQIFDTNKLRISLQNDNEAAKVVTLPTTSQFYPAFGALYRTANLSSVTVSATPTIIDFTSGYDEGTTASTFYDEINIDSSGTYKIEYSGSYQTQSPHVVSIYMNTYNNGVDIGYIGECRTRNDENGINNMTNFHRSFVTTLTVGDDISLWFKKSTGTDTTCSFYNVNLIVQRIY